MDSAIGRGQNELKRITEALLGRCRNLRRSSIIRGAKVEVQILRRNSGGSREKPVNDGLVV